MRSHILDSCVRKNFTNAGVYRFYFPLDDGKREIIVDPHNKRIKLLGIAPHDLTSHLGSDVLKGINVDEYALTKITVYSHSEEEGDWQELGFRREGIIRGFFAGRVDAHIWACYTNRERSKETNEDLHEQIVETALFKRSTMPSLPSGFRSLVASEADAAEIAELLAAIFTDYPTPINQEYIASQIATRSSHFRLIRDQAGTLAAVASAEIDHRRKTAEISDCATIPEYRGNELMTLLLCRLEKDMHCYFAISNLYALVRADVPGANFTFSKRGYAYSGRLINNCRMPNGWESMNVWHKST